VRKAGDESAPQGIIDERHDDRDRPGRLLGSLGRGPALRNDDIHLQTDQVSREGGVAIILALGPAEFDDDVLTFHVAQLAQALAEGLETAVSCRVRSGPGFR
jgi:hypothetical protein